MKGHVRCDSGIDGGMLLQNYQVKKAELPNKLTIIPLVFLHLKTNCCGKVWHP